MACIALSFARVVVTTCQVWDALVVQTRTHALMLAERFNRTVAVLPHPHGNLGGWGVARAVRSRIRAVGFVWSDTVRTPALFREGPRARSAEL